MKVRFWIYRNGGFVRLKLKGHPDGCDWWGGEWVPLRNGLLDLRFEVECEAHAEGYTHKYVHGETLYSKPKKERAA